MKIIDTVRRTETATARRRSSRCHLKPIRTVYILQPTSTDSYAHLRKKIQSPYKLRRGLKEAMTENERSQKTHQRPKIFKAAASTFRLPKSKLASAERTQLLSFDSTVTNLRNLTNLQHHHPCQPTTRQASFQPRTRSAWRILASSNCTSTSRCAATSARSRRSSQAGRSKQEWFPNQLRSQTRPARTSTRRHASARALHWLQTGCFCWHLRRGLVGFHAQCTTFWHHACRGGHDHGASLDVPLHLTKRPMVPARVPGFVSLFFWRLVPSSLLFRHPVPSSCPGSG